MDKQMWSNEAVAQAYKELRNRVVALLRELVPLDGQTLVPHCPKWTIQQLVSHMVGVPEDILASRMDGVTTELWTQAQVNRHADQTIAELADLYEQSYKSFDSVLEIIPSPINAQLVMDAVTHEHDLRHALKRPGFRDSAAVSIAAAWLLDRAQDRIGPEDVKTYFGHLDEFDLMRTLSGRRSLPQLQELRVSDEAIKRLFDSSPLTPHVKTIVE